jgi:FkbH-like protein
MKLAEALRITQEPALPEAEPLPVFLACGFTPLHLQTFLTAYLKKADPRRPPVLQTGLFGDTLGSLEGLPERGVAAAAVVLEWADFDPRLGLRQTGGWSPKDLTDILATARARAARFAEAIDRAAESHPVAVCLPTLPLPPLDFAPTWRAGAFTLELRAEVAALAARLGRSARVRLVNPQHLDQRSPPAERLDVRMELASGFPYRTPHAAVVAEQLALLLRPPPAKKGIITDLDDTLWSGVVGDVGVENISWDLDHHTQGHALYQQFLASLADAGVLVAAASKNDPAVVEAALARPDLVLPRDRLFPLEVHWQPKSGSVARILAAWNIGADSVVFVDDSPLELAEVQAAFPAIESLLFPGGDDAGVYQLLGRLRDLFGKEALREEDTLRRDSLRRAGQFHEATQAGSADPEALLRGLEAQVTLDLTKEPADPRALELINKTNQFNLNGRRWAEGTWLSYLKEPDTVLLTVSYKDKFGRLGKIAVLAGKRRGRVFLVEAWVMSCRAFARRIEHRCLEALFERLGAEEVEFAFAATERNEPLRDFLGPLLGEPPAAPARLARRSFQSRCPALYHKVEVISDG